MGLIQDMKKQIAKSSTSKREILYFGKDSMKRVRFLQEIEDGYMFRFHNDWATNTFAFCADQEDGEDCKLCKEGMTLQDNYIWSVWDYETSSVRLLQFKATGVTPIPAFIEMFEEFGTMMDRDYKIKKIGERQGASFVVTPMNKERFKNSKVKPYTQAQAHEILEKAWGIKDEEEEEEEEVTEKTEKKAATKKGAAKKRKPSVRERFDELDLSEVKDIAIEIGMTRKEIKGLDVEELLDELFDNYEESDLEEMLDDQE